MRIAVLSDIHGNLPALQAVLAEIAHEGVDLTVNLGDIASGPLWPAQTCDLLLNLQLPTIRGNHERQLLGDPARLSRSDAQTLPRLARGHLDWFAALPATLPLADFGAPRVLCVHGTPTSDLQYLLETVTPDLGVHGSPGVRAASAEELAQRLGDRLADLGGAAMPELLLCGHTHVPRIAGHGGMLIVNPGSVGLPAYDDDHPHPHVVENGSPHARWALLERSAGATGWHAALRATPYDFEAAAVQAESMARGDWADALRTGFVGRREADLPPRPAAQPESRP